jgi:hypothetical protein
MTGWKKAISPHVTYALSGYGSTQTPNELSLFVSEYLSRMPMDMLRLSLSQSLSVFMIYYRMFYKSTTISGA